MSSNSCNEYFLKDMNNVANFDWIGNPFNTEKSDSKELEQEELIEISSD